MDAGQHQPWYCMGRDAVPSPHPKRRPGSRRRRPVTALPCHPTTRRQEDMAMKSHMSDPDIESKVVVGEATPLVGNGDGHIKAVSSKSMLKDLVNNPLVK